MLDRLALPVPAAALALVLLLSVGPARAQLTGGLIVEVSDENGALPGATVTLSHPERRIREHAERTDDAGRAEFPVLPSGGNYVVEIAHPGYGTVRLDGLHVGSGRSRVIPVTLAEEYTEHVRVRERPPVVDLDQSTRSTRFSDEFIHDLPVLGRFYQNVLTLAPGVQDANGDGNPNVHGSRARDFKAMINGVSNVDPLTGQFRSNVNPNSIEEMEIITAGAGPEFGRAQGGFANIVQKQGSNEFEGLFDLIYRSSGLDGDGAASLPKARIPDFEWLQPSLQVSGPIVRDRLWYRLSHEWIDREDPVNTLNTIEVVTHRQQINSDQLTWQVSPRNKLAFKFDANPIDIDNFGVSSLTPSSASQRIGFEADTYSVVWSAPYSPRVFVESLAAWQKGGFRLGPSSRGVTNECVRGLEFLVEAQCRDLRNGRTTGSYWRDFQDHRQRFTAKTDATVQLRRRVLGATHQLKFGFIVENERYVRDVAERPRFTFDVFRPLPVGGGIPLEAIGVANVEFSVPAEDRARATGTTWGLYVKDQIKPRQNLTLEIGGRLEREFIDAPGLAPFSPAEELAAYEALLEQGLHPIHARIRTFTAYEGSQHLQAELGRILGVSGELNHFFGPVVNQSAAQLKRRRPLDLRLLNTNFSPFFAMSWDPWSNAKTKLAFTAGRHYNNIPLIVALQELNPAASSIQLVAQRAPGGWVVDSLAGVRGKMNPVATLRVVDHELRTPYQDELTFTFQRELWAETSVGLTWIRRDYRDQLQDTDINHVSGDFGRCVPMLRGGDSPVDFSQGPDGVVDDCSGAYMVGPPDNRGAVTTFPLLARPDGLPDLYTLNPFWGSIYRIANSNRARYEGVVLEVVRRQYRGWELQGSYTWSMARGDGEDFNQFLGDDHSLAADERGFQSTDQRHVVKLAATTITPWGIRLGGTVTWQSGLPYSVLTQRLSFDTAVPSLAGFGAYDGRSRLAYRGGLRNGGRNRSYWDFNVKAAREFVMPGGGNLQLALEVFNLLNDGTYVIYNPFLETGFRLNGSNDAYRRFGRRFQLGMRLGF